MDDEMNTGGAAPDTAPEAPAADTGTPDAGSQAAEPQAEEQHVPDAAIQVDPETGRRRVVFPSAEQAPPAQEQAPQEATPQEPQAPQQYSANDLVQLVATGQQIDPSRVPQELQGYAAAIQQQRINAAQAQQMQAVQRETQETMQAIMPKWNEYKQDPHYNDIDNMMGEFYKTLPFEEGAKVKQSIDRFLAGRPVKADVDILDNYYKRTKEAYYAKATGVSTTPQPVQKAKPPRVEQPGQHGATTPQKVDWSKMRGMTPRQRSQFLQTYLR